METLRRPLKKNVLSKSCDGTLNDDDDDTYNLTKRDDDFCRLRSGLKEASKSYDSLMSSRRRTHHDDDLTDQDIVQVEAFFRSHKTAVFVCQCLANLYFRPTDGGPWQLARTGLPVLLLDKGETRARRKRMLQIVLAEKGSGFVLWRDVIDNLTNYNLQDATFHTMCLSSDHTQTVGLSFDSVAPAMEFYEQIEHLTSDPLNISLSVPKKKSKSFRKKLAEKMKLPRKCDISQPCCFQHVTSVALDDKEHLFSLATLVSSTPEDSE